jgi:DDE superfamily endonuclease
MDETSKQLLRDTKEPLPMEPGRVQRRDYEYERGGVVNLFVFCEPLEDRRWVDVTEHRTKADLAHQIKELVDERYPKAERIVLVMDNLNTHTQPHFMGPSIPRRQGGSPRRSLRSTTPQARLVAEHGRHRTEYAQPTMSRSTSARL